MPNAREIYLITPTKDNREAAGPLRRLPVREIFRQNNTRLARPHCGGPGPEQPSPAALGRSCRSTPRYQKRSWWLDTSTTAQSRRAVKRWHGCAQDLWDRNVEIAAWVALGAAQAHVGAKYGLTRQRVGQIIWEFEWVRQAVRDRLRSLDENNGREGGKCQSSLRGEGGVLFFILGERMWVFR